VGCGNDDFFQNENNNTKYTHVIFATGTPIAAKFMIVSFDRRRKTKYDRRTVRYECQLFTTSAKLIERRWSAHGGQFLLMSLLLLLDLLLLLGEETALLRH